MLSAVCLSCVSEMSGDAEQYALNVESPPGGTGMLEKQHDLKSKRVIVKAKMLESNKKVEHKGGRYEK